MVLYDRNGGLKWVKNYLLNQGGGSLLNPFEASAAFHAETATRGVL